jgi:ribonuclease P protein component
LIVLFVLTASDLERKTGFVAGRRVGNAVARNRAKRLLREAFRHHKQAIPEHGYHLVLVARNGCGEAGFQDVERDLLAVLREAGFDDEGSKATVSSDAEPER